MAQLLVVVHHEDIPVGKNHFFRRRIPPLKVEDDMELGAHIQLAVYLDGALVFVHNVFRDGHAEAGTLHLAHAGVVLAHKGFKDLLLELLCHPHAVILYPEMGADVAFAPRGILLGDGHGDVSALRRKFEGVGEQV